MKRRDQIVAGMVMFLTVPAPAQQAVPEARRHLSGSVAVGYLDSSAQEFFVDRIRNPFTSVRFDYQSYLLDPDFLSYRVQPRFSTGFQDGFTGMTEGTGVAVDTEFLRRRPWPFQFHYARLRRQLYNSSQSGSYTRYRANSDDEAIGLRWQYLVPRQPHFEVSFNKFNTQNLPEEILFNGFETRSETLAVSGSDQRWGWQINGSAGFQNLESRYLLGYDQETVLFPSRNKLKNYWISGHRELGEKMAVSLWANRTGNSSEYTQGTYRQDFDSVQAKFEYNDRDRLTMWGAGRQTRSDLSLEVKPGGGQPGYNIPPTEVMNRIADSEIRYQVLPGLRALGRFQFNSVTSPLGQVAARAGNYTNAGAGAQYSRNWKWTSVDLMYYLYKTISDFAFDAAANRRSHAADASLTTGDPRWIRVGVSGSWVKARENMRTFLPFFSDNERYRLTLARTLLGRWNLEVEGGYTRMKYDREDLHSDYASREYGATLTGPGVYLGYFRGAGSGNSFSPILGVPAPGLPSEILPPQFLVSGSSNKTTTYTASWKPMRRLLIRGVWRKQEQEVARQFSSLFEQQEATLGYQFRRLRFEAGYIVYKYNFGTPIYRKNLVFRVTRDFQLF